MSSSTEELPREPGLDGARGAESLEGGRAPLESLEGGREALESLEGGRAAESLEGGRELLEGATEEPRLAVP